MKGKIDKQGHLWVERGSALKRQECRIFGGLIGANLAFSPCCDNCPLFGEPQYNGGTDFSDKEFREERKLKGEHYGAKLGICQGKELGFEEFADERESIGAYQGGDDV